MSKTIDDVWTEFQELYGQETPTRNKEQLKAALHAAGMRSEDVTGEWFLAELLPEWVEGTDSRPFANEKWNDEYEHLCALRGIDTSDEDMDEEPFDGDFDEDDAPTFDEEA